MIEKGDELFINAHPPRVAGSCLLNIMLRIQNKYTLYDGLIYQSTHGLFKKKQVSNLLEMHPDKRFISSHGITLDLPFDRKNLIAIAFVRDPIEKIRSHYSWARTLEADDEFPEAKKLSFEDFVEKFVFKKEKSKVNSILSRFMINQIDFFFPEVCNKKEKLINLMEQKRLLLFPVENFDEVCVLLERMFPEFFYDLSYSESINPTTKKKLSGNISNELKECDNLQNDYNLMKLSKLFLKKSINNFFKSNYDFNSAIESFKRRCLKKKIGQFQGKISHNISHFLSVNTIKSQNIIIDFLLKNRS